MPPTDQAFEVREKLAALEEALLTSLPSMPSLLRDIHRNLKADPDVVTLLSEEECAILVTGLKKQTGTEIATSALKGPRKKAISKMTVADL
jgi:hypothetical protein